MLPSMHHEKTLFDGDTDFEHYQIIEMVYNGHKARVLFSGQRSAAQSAMPIDGSSDLLFDYNERFMELTTQLKPKRLLLIGGGAFTLPMAILKNLPDIYVDVVERDPKLQILAEKYFGLKKSKKLNVFHEDGYKFLENNNRSYELILVDAFTHNVIPKTFSTVKFANLLKANLSSNGAAAINIISAYHGPNSEIIIKQIKNYKSAFNHTTVFPADKMLSYWISQNFLIVVDNKLRKQKYKFRFEALPEPIS
jgi:spermidine synthase